MTFQSVLQWQCSYALAFQPRRAGSEVAGRQASKQDVWQHAKSSAAAHFPEDHKCSLSHPQSRGAVSTLDTQVAADSPTAYSGHKQAVMNDEQVSWQVPSSIWVISSADTETEYVTGGKKRHSWKVG